MCGGGSKKNRVEETAEQKELAKIAAERYARAEEFKPYQELYMKRVDSLNGKGAYEESKGVVNQQYQKAFTDAGDKLATQVTSTPGADPNSGKAKTAFAALESQQGTKTGEGATKSDMTQYTRYAKGLQDVVAIGQGKATDAQVGLSDVANSAQQMAQTDAATSLSKSNDKSKLIGTVVGVAGRAGLNMLNEPTGTGKGKYLMNTDSM